jgi:hypothetical protein
MKIVLSIIIIGFVTLFSGNSFSQSNQFRIVYNNVSIFLSPDAEWSEMFDAQNTFVMNANENKDIIHYRGDGTAVTYRNIGELQTKYTDKGERYQILNVLDDDDNPISFQLFDDVSIGVKLITEDGLIQFSNF